MAESRNRYLETLQGSQKGVAYTKLPTEEESNDKSLRKKSRTFSEIVTFEKVAWVSLAAFLCYFTEFVPNLMYNEEINRTWLAATLFFFFTTSSVFIFLVCYCSFLQGIASDDWNQHYPYAIPIATASIIFFEICLCVSIWPVYSYLAPLILLIFLIAFVCFVSLLDVSTLLFKK